MNFYNPNFLAEQIRAYPSQIACAAKEDGKECPCRCGWILNPYDFWQECPIHYAGQDHPEMYGYERDSEEVEERKPFVDEIPFAEWIGEEVPF
jgi:hypothetical protein